jgi:molybdopterin synthase sulfur carrier subunit
MARILYFAALVDQLERASETVTLPPDVTNVRALLAWLRVRGGRWEQRLVERGVQVTVDRQFAVPETRVTDDSEIGIVPTVPW